MLWHPEHRLRRTMLTVIVDGVRHTPLHESTTVEWGARGELVIRWLAGTLDVEERLRVFSTDKRYLAREVHITSGVNTIGVEAALYANPILFDDFSATDELEATGCHTIRLNAALEARYFERFCTVEVELTFDAPIKVPFLYSFENGGDRSNTDPISGRYHNSASQLTESGWHGQVAGKSRLQEQLLNSCRGMRAAVSFDGRFNASLFQYEFEWGMDAAMIASAACSAGYDQLASEVLENILTRLSNDEGMIAEASRLRGGELSELNGNGAVLDALGRYHRHTRDDSFIRKHWQRIVAIAEYPLRDEFAHECGMLRTRRDFWERYPWQGVGDGFELGHQVLCSVGLAAAAQLASIVDDKLHMLRWSSASERIHNAMLEHPTHRLVENGHFIRRRRVDGSHEDALVRDDSWSDGRFAPYVMPGVDAKPRRCEPDATEVLPIIYGLVDARSDVARSTLDAIDALWSPNGIGGFARYNVASEPDSPGPWPFATAMIAAAQIASGRDEHAQRSIDWMLDSAGAGGSWLEFYGVRESPPLPPTGIIVWGWAQYILLVVDHLAGVVIGYDSVTVRPRAIGLVLAFLIGAHNVSISINGLGSALIDGEDAELIEGALSIDLPLLRDHTIEFQ